LVILVMGVAGSGKTTVGVELARQLGWEFADADDFHSASNVEKMRSGTPLTDTDRAPWLKALRSHIAAWIDSGRHGVLACSALKQTYRERLQISEAVRVVYLCGTPELLAERLLTRQGHYMKPQMLASQLAALEEPHDAVAVDIGATPAEIVREIRQRLDLL
jgi:gluconokinase